MLTYEPARTEQYEEFLRLMRSEVADYLERTMALMPMTWEEFACLFKTQGQVEGIYQDGQLAGFYWIEERRQVLHLHGLIVKEQFRGQGIGTQVLEMLATRYRTSMTTIELGVQRSNEQAARLYERLGFQTVRTLDDLGFVIMQKRLFNSTSLGNNCAYSASTAASLGPAPSSVPLLATISSSQVAWASRRAPSSRYWI